MPHISIVITTTNRYTQLRKTFESFVPQSFKDYEVVVIDDGNDAETPAMCAEAWPFQIRYFCLNRAHPKGFRGCSSAANYGVRQARADIIILQNAECKHVGNVIADLASRVTPGNVVLCRADHMNLDGTINPEKTDYMNIVREKQALFFCGAIYKEWFYRLGGFDESYDYMYGAEDIDFSHRLQFAGAQFDYLTNSYVQHQWHPVARTGTEYPNGEYFDSQRKAHAQLIALTEGMKAGTVSPVRNQDREWGRIKTVSVVITTFFRAALLENTLASITSQKVENLEIVVVDDGNDKETPDICQKYGTTYIRINRPQSNKYRDSCRPANIGVKHAKGSIIILQNAECKHVDPQTIHKLVQAVKEDTVAFAKVTALNADGSEEGVYCGKIAQRPYFFCGAITKVLYEQLRGMDEDYPGGGYDDNDFGDRLRASGVKFDFTDINVIHQYHTHLGYLDIHSAEEMYKNKSRLMKDGIISPIRNLDREWGALEPTSEVVDSTWDFVPEWGSFPPPPPSTGRLPNEVPAWIRGGIVRIPGAGHKYAKDGLTVNWWDTHRRIG